MLLVSVYGWANRTHLSLRGYSWWLSHLRAHAD